MNHNLVHNLWCDLVLFSVWVHWEDTWVGQEWGFMEEEEEEEEEEDGVMMMVMVMMKVELLS